MEPPLLWLDSSADQQATGTADTNAGTSLQGKTILLVCPGAPGRWRLLHSLRASGVHIVCYSTYPEVTWAAEYIRQEDWLFGPLGDSPSAVELVRGWLRGPIGSTNSKAAQQRAIHGVLCYDEYGIPLAAALAEAFGLRYVSSALAAELRCKYHFRTRCAQAGIRCPGYVHLSSAVNDGQDSRLATLRYPVVAKPTQCAGSFSVVRCDTPSDLVTASNRYFSALPQYLASFGLPADASTTSQWGMIVEELVVGAEVDIDCVVVEGRLVFAVVSDNHPQPQDQDCATFIERGGRCPSVLPHDEQAALLRMACDVVSLWGPGLTGVFHLEALSTHDMGPVPIELNGRIGGAETYTNVLAAWGVDLVAQAARLAVGLSPSIPHTTLATHPWPSSSSHSLRLVGPHWPGCSTLHAASQSCSSDDDQAASDSAAARAANMAGSSDDEQAVSVGQAVSLRLGIAGLRVGSGQRRSEDSSGGVSPTQASSCSLCASSAGSCDHHSLLSYDAVASVRPHVGCPTQELAPKASLLPPAGAPPGVRLGAHMSHSRGSSRDGPAGQSGPHSRSDSADGAVSTDSDTLQPQKALGHPTAWPCLVQTWQGAGQRERPDHGPDCLVLARPLTHVYSVNFVPEWRGEGVLEDYRLDLETREHPAFVDAELYCKPGKVVKLPPAGYSALGWMVSKGDTAQRAEEAMSELMSGLHIRLAPAPPEA